MSAENIENTSAKVVYLVAIDGSPAGDHVLDVACGLGTALGGRAELHIVHVIGSGVADVPVVAPILVTPTDMIESGRAVLDAAVTRSCGSFAGAVISHLAAGDPWREVTSLAAKLSADLVVVGTAGRTGIARVALGSVAEQILRHAGCPVLVVRPKEHHIEASAGETTSIEPPCPACLEARKAKPAHTWCERHAAHHAHGRLHYETPPSFGLGSMLVRP